MQYILVVFVAAWGSAVVPGFASQEECEQAKQAITQQLQYQRGALIPHHAVCIAQSRAK